ncbi:MAG TPA: class I SAM-dependent methyltransferase [Gammaproteobacteria bacterium]|nr:class I SAM-dependent methyltransferase [Gammaproteobacteria bacterium]
MSDEDRNRWDQRYRNGSYRPRPHPTELLQQWQPELPRGRALDIACGAGRNALYLAACGYEVDAVDISPTALEGARAEARERGLEVHWIQADLDSFLPTQGHYDLVVVARYANRKLLPRLARALKPGGALLYEHHILTELEVDGPKDPDFRLAPDELRKQFAQLDIRFYREGLVKDPDGRTMALAQMVAFRDSVNDE